MIWSGIEVSMMGTVMSLLIAHLIGDFLLQSRWMADGKSSSNKKLLVHGFVYCFILMAFCVTLASSWQMALMYVIFNGIMHVATDFVTSRATKQAFEDGDMHSAFLVIGLDQTFHYLTLFLTIPLLG
jgi:hypothetical protein